MVLNLLQRHDLTKARELVERSFGRYLASLDLVEEEDTLSQLRLQLGQLGLHARHLLRRVRQLVQPDVVALLRPRHLGALTSFAAAQGAAGGGTAPAAQAAPEHFEAKQSAERRMVPDLSPR